MERIVAGLEEGGVADPQLRGPWDEGKRRRTSKET